MEEILTIFMNLLALSFHQNFSKHNSPQRSRGKRILFDICCNYRASIPKQQIAFLVASKFNTKPQSVHYLIIKL